MVIWLNGYRLIVVHRKLMPEGQNYLLCTMDYGQLSSPKMTHN